MISLRWTPCPKRLAEATRQQKNPEDKNFIQPIRIRVRNGSLECPNQPGIQDTNLTAGLRESASRMRPGVPVERRVGRKAPRPPLSRCLETAVRMPAPGG